jgi:hypothetical protein
MTQSTSGTTDEERTKWRHRTYVLVALGVVLVAQGAYAARPQPQPYPAFVLPGFRNVAVGGEVSSDDVAITARYQDGTTLHPTPPDVFGVMIYSAIPGTIDYVFDPEVDGSDERITDDVRAWLRTRLTDLDDGAVPESISFCWRSVTVDINELSATTQPCDRTRTVPLNDAD